MDVKYEKERVSLIAPELTPLPWLASGLEGAILWYFGRCCFNVKLQRMWTAGGGVTVAVMVAPP